MFEHMTKSRGSICFSLLPPPDAHGYEENIKRPIQDFIDISIKHIENCF